MGLRTSEHLAEISKNKYWITLYLMLQIFAIFFKQLPLWLLLLFGDRLSKGFLLGLRLISQISALFSVLILVLSIRWSIITLKRYRNRLTVDASSASKNTIFNSLVIRSETSTSKLLDGLQYQNSLGKAMVK